MLYFPKAGNIKFGGVKNGLPQQFQKMKITGNSKDGEENFTPFNGTETEGYDSIQVQLPMLTQSFEYGLISFIEIMDNKYYAKQVGEDIVMFPLNDRHLPVIKTAATNELINTLQMDNRALLYVMIPKEENEFLGGGMSVFMYKTASAFSINEIQNTMSIIEEMDPNILRNLKLTLEVTKKMVNLKDLEDISYVRLLLPSPKAVMEAQKASVEQQAINTYLEETLKRVQDSRTQAVESAISIEDAEKLFGKKIVFKIDNSFKTDITSAPTKTNKVLSADEEQLATDLSAEFSLPRPLILTLVKNAGTESRAVIERVKSIEGIIKYISGSEKDVAETPVVSQDTADKPVRTRRTKAEIEAAK